MQPIKTAVTSLKPENICQRADKSPFLIPKPILTTYKYKILCLSVITRLQAVSYGLLHKLNSQADIRT